MTKSKGLFITIDGPNGVGKSSVVEQLYEMFAKLGQKTYLTKEPTLSPLGSFIRKAEEKYNGKTLAYLVAADREYHIEFEIKPAIRRSEVVISDRYICSSLALQGLDGLDSDFIWNLNRDFLVPDLTVVLMAKEDELHQRLQSRNRFSRFERTKSRLDEINYFKDGAKYLHEHGYKVVIIENNDMNLMVCVQKIMQHIQNLIHFPAGT